MFESGEKVGPYEVISKLGQGGMATVFKAHHTNLDRFVAIKVMHPAFKQDENFLARFEREARLIARLEHPNIVPVYDFDDYEGNPYLVMRFIEGQTLKAILKAGPLSAVRIAQIVGGVGAGLQYAHEQGVLHRDIKPSNIMITNDGKIFLTDFGLARMATTGESTISRDMLLGTPQYVSPEQAQGTDELGPRSDIYSLGVVIYELIVGRVPFSADTPYAIIHDHIFTPLPRPRKIKPEVPQPIEDFLIKALAKKPADRYLSVAEMVGAFNTALEESGEASLAAASAAKPLPESTVRARAASAANTPVIRSVAESAADPSLTLRLRRLRRRRMIWPLIGIILLILVMVTSSLTISQAVIDTLDDVYNVEYDDDSTLPTAIP
ncbi:MAG: serine/threonine protein kinase [Chloroflexi bacterium]|nr:serine/threonine protein kinase [Chloroflexota bacterium]